MKWFPLILRLFVILGILGAGAALVWAVSRPAVPRSDASFTVAATIFPLADITRHVAGSYVDVQLLIPPGTSEHSSALKPDQVAQVAQARVVFQIGHGLDDRLTSNVRKVNPAATLVTVDQGIALRKYTAEEEHHHNEDEEEHEEAGSTDAHYWLTVPNARHIATTIATTLTTLDPEHATDYQQNLERYHTELDALESELQALAVGAPQKHFIAMHNAWSYLAEHYGFELVATYEPVEGQQPTVTDLQDLQKVVQRYALSAFYAEPQKASSGAVRFIERELGLTVRALDPVGGTPPQDSYIDLMRHNITALVESAAR